jgi:hypothetical protein
MMAMKMKLLSVDYHRNGVSGEPFITGLFTDEEGHTKMFVDFGEMRFAVLQVDKLAKGDIAFGSNSWRGDLYVNEIRSLYDESLKGCLYADD